jgi:hypothetical protein
MSNWSRLRDRAEGMGITRVNDKPLSRATVRELEAAIGSALIAQRSGESPPAEGDDTE